MNSINKKLISQSLIITLIGVVAFNLVSISNIPYPNFINSILILTLLYSLIYRIKKSIKESEYYKEKLNTLFNRSEEGILVINQEETILKINQKLLTILGYEKEEIIGKKIENILTPIIENDQKTESLNLKNTTTFSGKTFIYLLQKKNNKTITVELHIWKFDYLENKSYIFFVNDISEKIKHEKEITLHQKNLKKQSEQLKLLNHNLESRVKSRTKELKDALNNLEESNSKLNHEIAENKILLTKLNSSTKMYEAIAESFPNGIICVLDSNFHYIYAQGHELKLHGFTDEQIIGKPFKIIGDEKICEEIKTILKNTFKGDKVSFEYKTTDDSAYYLVTAVPLQSKINETNQILVVTQNITTLKIAEKETLKLLEKERELNEMKSRFVSTASHEFRTPLGAILSSASLISMYNNIGDETKRNKHIERIVGSVSNLTEILNDFLSLGKIEEGKVTNQPVEFDVIDFCEDTIEEIGITTKPYQEIKVNYRMTNSLVNLDKQLLRNILLNLLTNAIKYSSVKSVITFDVIKQNGELIFSVKDQGIGIPKEDQKNLFETFFRASNVENIKGTGMGLHIVKKYLDIMDGKIEFESAINKGSCFTVKFNC